MATRVTHLTPTPKMDVLLGNKNSHIFAYNQSRLSIGAYISVFNVPYDHIRCGSKKGQTSLRLDGH